jgi:prophage antirepressor-like protein
MDKDKELVPFTYVEQEHPEIIDGLAKCVGQRDWQIRTLLIDGMVWWIAKDVCDILGLENVTEALRNLDDDERNTLRITEGIQQNRGNPNVNIINEMGLFHLIFQSYKPRAKLFKRWIWREVLPAMFKRSRSLAPRTPSPLEIDDMVKAKLKHELLIAKPDYEVKQAREYISKHLRPNQPPAEKADFFRIYSDYASHVEFPMEKEAFLNEVQIVFPAVKRSNKGGYFIGCKLEYDKPDYGNTGRRI